MGKLSTYYCYFLLKGKSLEWGLRKKGVLKAVRELDGNERESCEALLKDVSMYARGKIY